MKSEQIEKELADKKAELFLAVKEKNVEKVRSLKQEVATLERQLLELGL